MTMKVDSIRTTTSGWKRSRPTSPYPSICITVPGREVVVAVTQGKLDFGPWEQIFYGEFDGRRKKRALVKIIGE